VIDLNTSITLIKGENTIKTPQQIHKWNCHKLESFSDFMDSFAGSTRKKPYCYLELFTGYGVSPCGETECQLEGSALRAVKSKAKFKRFSFLAQNKTISENLISLVEPYNTKNNIEIFAGNPNNEKSLRRLLDIVPRASSSFAFIDPGGYRRLNWSTLEKIASHGKNWQGEKTELLIVFPLEMALVRNLMRPECENSLSRFYGNQQWEDIKRQKRIGKADPEDIKYKLVEIFKTGLHNLGYRYVEDFKPASPTHDPYFHLIYAGDSVSRLKQIKDAWGKSRFLRCELLYRIKDRKSS
jgi:three-Cys-motif partner protein